MPQNNFNDDLIYVSEDLMPKISRTFDFTLRILPQDLRDDLRVAYAFCRAIDNVEDSSLSYRRKVDLMNKIVSVFSSGDVDSAKGLERTIGKIRQTKEGYVELMGNYSRVVGASRVLDKNVVDLIASCGRQMADGLSNPVIQNIRSIEDHHRYCHYAAGVVGDLISRDMFLKGYLSENLLGEICPIIEDNLPLIGRSPSHDFAVALQVTNNLKDLRNDLQNGIRRWPKNLLSSNGLTFEIICDSNLNGEKLQKAYEVLRLQIEDARSFFSSATSWVDRIPYFVKGKEDSSLEGIKRSWGMALAFSAATLSKIDSEKFFTDEGCRKITREEVIDLSSKVEEVVSKKGKIRDLIAKL